MEDFKTGTKGVNKQGLAYVVLDGKVSKKTKIKFENDGAEVVTTKAYLRTGLPCHPTWGKMLVGNKYIDNKGNEIVLVEKLDGASWKIRWSKDNVEATREGSSIKAGSVKHPKDGIPMVGEIWETNFQGKIEIVENNGAHDILVRFEDGTLRKCSAAQIREGTVGHPTSGLVVGKTYLTNSGWSMTVKEYKDPWNVLIEFEDGYQAWYEAGDIKSGSIKPPYQPSVSGVGFFGAGKYDDYRKQGDNKKPPTVIVEYWRRMITRCYNADEIMKNTGRKYVYVEVNKDWFNFHNFIEWTESQPNWNKGFELDKDLIGGGIEYSPDKCCFLPAEVNQFLSDSWKKSEHFDLPTGVQYIKPGTKGAKDGYVARCHTENGREYLGYFDTAMDAHLVYKKRKEEYAKVLAEKYVNDIVPLAYEKLLEYKVPTFSTFDFELSCHTK